MTDLFYPDRSQFQGQTDVKAHAIMARATEGTHLTDTCFEFNKRLAHGQGALFAGYHFLEDGSTATAQAAHAIDVIGKAVPAMGDFEPIMGSAAAFAARGSGDAGHYCGSAWAALQAWRQHPVPAGVTMNDASVLASAPFISKPTVPMMLAFVDAYRAKGGIMYDAYLPHWYWELLGRPSLQGFIDRHMFLTSSSYTTYSDKGPGWEPYGGMHPQKWQYTDDGPGHQDWNAFKARSGSVTGAVAELRSLWHTGRREPAPKPAGPPFRHVTKGGETLAALAASRNVDPAHLVRTSAAHYTEADRRAAFHVPLPADVPWYSEKP